MRFAHQVVRSPLLILALVFALAACTAGGPGSQAAVPAPSVTPPAATGAGAAPTSATPAEAATARGTAPAASATARGTAPAAAGAAGTTAPAGAAASSPAALTFDVPALYISIPSGGRAGGGSPDACTRDGVPDLTRSPEEERAFYATSGEIAVGASLDLCYFNFSLGPVREQVFAPDGELVRELSFTVEPRSDTPTLETNLFTALPDDAPGTYRVVATTPDGTLETTFEVSSVMAKRPLDSASILILGRGPGGGETRTAAYAWLAGFQPDEKVDVFVYATCEPDDRIKNVLLEGKRLKSLHLEMYVGHARVPVDRSGSAVVPFADLMPPSFSDEYAYSFYIRTRDQAGPLGLPPTATPDTAGASRPSAGLAVTDPNLLGVLTSVAGTAAGADGAEPTCPLPPDLPIPTSAAQAAPGRLRWTASLDEESLYTLEVVGGAVLTFDWDGGLTALDAETGAASWAARRARAYAADGEAVYLLPDQSSLQARSARTGEVTWEYGIANGAATTLEVLHVGASDGVVYIAENDPGGTSALVAVDQARGAQRWRFVSPDGRVEQFAGLGGTVFVVTPRQLYALDPGSGEVRWSLADRYLLPNTPRPYSGDTIYLGAPGGVVVAVDRATGEERWSYQLELWDVDVLGQLAYGNCEAPWICQIGHIGNMLNLTPSEGAVFVSESDDLSGSDHEVLALDATTGRTMWALSSSGWSRPTFVDGVVYIGDTRGVLHAIDAGSGEVRWTYEVEGSLHLPPAVVGDTVYVPGGDGYLHAVDRATGEGLWQLGTEGLADLTVGPVVAGQTIYVGDAGVVYAVEP